MAAKKKVDVGAGAVMVPARFRLEALNADGAWVPFFRLEALNADGAWVPFLCSVARGWPSEAEAEREIDHWFSCGVDRARLRVVGFSHVPPTVTT